MTVTADTVFDPVIGLEVHAQLLTKSKAFTSVSTEFGASPNTNVSPLCLGMPGTLPVVNENLIRYIIKMGLATNCKIAPKSIFARKNYFYPDLPKGYQISQYDTPICFDGHIDIELKDGTEKRIGITRIHMEEDAGKSIHDQDPYNTLVDLNRAGTPLIEIVSEPDIRTAEEAYAYLTKIKQIVQYLEICDGNMEEGSLRCDANVSIRPRGQEKFGTRTELKNMNSFRNVERAINYEIERQEQVIRNGGEIIQTTLLWDANKMVTREMRSKEEAHDYRYFPEPDIPPIVVTDELLGEIRADLPEMPDVRRERFEKDFKLSDYDANLITEDRYFADFYEAILDHYNEPKAVANLVTSEVLRVLNELSVDIRSFAIDAKRLATLVKMKDDDKISSSAMQTIFNEMLSSEKEPEAIAEEKNLVQVSDTGFIEELVDDVIAKFPDKVEAYQSGKKGLMGFFIGQVMQNSKGQANPQMARKAIIDKIGE
jgi:aspartyl-tRNA(Asn)/glutamyl-tRNA(Gln) amidotransferase subunit B